MVVYITFYFCCTSLIIMGKTESCVLLVSDFGFTLKDDFSVLGVSLIIPAFTRGKKQLTGRDNEESRIKSKIRIHIGKYIYFP